MLHVFRFSNVILSFTIYFDLKKLFSYTETTEGSQSFTESALFSVQLCASLCLSVTVPNFLQKPYIPTVEV